MGAIRHKFFVHLLLVLALVSAGISPACKFIAGQYDVLEICGAHGAKTVLVPASQSPVQKQDNTDHHKQDCAFCFASGHVKAATATPVVYLSPLENIIRMAVFVVFENLQPKIFSTVSARGPPSSISPR